MPTAVSLRSRFFVRISVFRLLVITAICLLLSNVFFHIASTDIFATTVDRLCFGKRFGNTSSTAAETAAMTTTTTTDVGVVVYDDSTTRMYRGLGNHIFGFAVVVHVAERSGRQVVATGKLQLDNVFELTNVRRVAGGDELCPCFRFGEEKALAFDQRIEQMARPDNPETRNKSIFLDGYYQSWK